MEGGRRKLATQKKTQRGPDDIHLSDNYPRISAERSSDARQLKFPDNQVSPCLSSSRAAVEVLPGDSKVIPPLRARDGGDGR